MMLNPEGHITNNSIFCKDDSVVYVSEEDIIRLQDPHNRQ